MENRTKQEEYLSPGFAVFNLHVNDAGQKADAEFKRMFGQEVFDKVIAPCHKKGIMSIFEKRPDLHTSAWVTLCTYFVNQE